MSERELERATLGGGCFWCLEPVFELLRGVEEVTCGYAGGSLPDPTYREVCGGDTGHAEVVQVLFDPAVITYERLLELFFEMHDPTTPDRQGPDVGSQYRSIILFHSEAQKEAAERAIAGLASSGRWPDPIVTEVVPLETFYPAEPYHQRYYERNPSAPYCLVMIAPKVAKARAEFEEELKSR
ncbi:MAG: peptide-methionine (S)-S-oxide reductase MsrA [Gemmatimonadota bacterium]